MSDTMGISRDEMDLHHPPLFWVILALIIAPVVLALPLFEWPVGALLMAERSYAVAWLFFAPIYFILRWHVAISIGVCIAMGAASAMMASLAATSYFTAIDIHLSTYSAGIGTALSAFAEWAPGLTFYSIISSSVFWLMIRNATTGAGSPANPSATFSSNFKAIARIRALRAFVVLVLFSAIGLYWLRVTKEQANESADSGIEELYERNKTLSPNPVVIQIPREFRYEGRAGRTGKWKDDKRSETSLFTFYPSFTSPRDPANVAQGLEYCNVGYCGAISLTVKNVKLSLRDGQFSNYADVTASIIFKYSTTRPVDAKFGFDEVFDETRPTGHRFLLKSSSDKASYDLVAECSMGTTIHICKLSFSLACNPAIGVEVNWWLYEHMDEALELRRRVDEFVSSMVKEPKCGQ